MFWNWASAAQRRYLAIRAENACDAILRALESRTLEHAPREFVDELVAATQQLAVVAPADLESMVGRAERLVERMKAYGASSEGPPVS